MEIDIHTCKKGYEKGNELININIETHRSLINCSDSNCPDRGKFYKCYSKRVKQSEPILKRISQTN